jgi:hypothetical protein
MAQLKKIDASTLLESLIASVLIVVIFLVSSLILNNVINSKINKETKSVDYYISKIEYQYINQEISLPYEQYLNDWKIEVVEEVFDDPLLKKITITAQHIKRNVTQIKHLYVAK